MHQRQMRQNGRADRTIARMRAATPPPHSRGPLPPYDAQACHVEIGANNAPLTAGPSSPSSVATSAADRPSNNRPEKRRSIPFDPGLVLHRRTTSIGDVGEEPPEEWLTTLKSTDWEEGTLNYKSSTLKRRKRLFRINRRPV